MSGIKINTIFHCLKVLVVLLVYSHLLPTNHSLPIPQELNHGLLPVEKLFNLSTFMVGSVHHDWVLKREFGVLEAAERALGNKRDKCFVVDVGMNDGFYTQLGAAYGCQVYSFELQQSCIEISRSAAAANNFTDLITITRAPVSSEHNKLFLLGHGDDQQRNRCDGGFSISGEHPEKRAHKPFTVIGHHRLHTVKLDSFIPRSARVDFLKVDVEGLDLEVITGAERLFQEKRVARAAIEIVGSSWGKWELAMARKGELGDKFENYFQDEFKNMTNIYRRIFSYGYGADCVTNGVFNKDWTVFNKNFTFEQFSLYVLKHACLDWEFFLRS